MAIIDTKNLGGPFEEVSCPTCKEPHYVDEPCPACTAGDYEAAVDRLEASKNRESFLLRLLADALMEKAEAADDGPKEA